MWRAWSFALIRLCVAGCSRDRAGAGFWPHGLWLTAVLAAVLAWQFVNLFRLHHWLRHRSARRAARVSADSGATWSRLIGRIYRRKQFHKRRVTQLFREFRRLSAALPDGVVLLSEDREILWFNRTAAGLLGLRRKVDIGLPIANLVRNPEFSSYLERLPATGGVIVRLRGGETWLALFVIPAGGQYLMLVRDVTREARLEQMRKDFVANASHELRSPLTVIAGYVDELAEGGGVGEEWREPIADMRRQSRRMREIVEDLLELSRLESSADEAPMSAVDMPALLERLVQEARASTPGAPRFELDIDYACVLGGSEGELHSIAANLLSNAVKYTPADGTITLSWGRDDTGARLAVEDTGIGISPEHLPRLTERFYRVDRARARAKGGSGLGLVDRKTRTPAAWRAARNRER